ncbi:uncharacterized protein LOC111613386 [Centruroides sculpturatus]|uniref:uncharacterized protein LOC111613386 n=1 Tax=Centruroides sculpturatus TaxID=218467 RepID=UPI000C6ED00B|nr:uncharacterized protein LOC111613386 [Centruroides sculpturatus]
MRDALQRQIRIRSISYCCRRHLGNFCFPEIASSFSFHFNIFRTNFHNENSRNEEVLFSNFIIQFLKRHGIVLETSCAQKINKKQKKRKEEVLFSNFIIQFLKRHGIVLETSCAQKINKKQKKRKI